jgi:hypothetical protein
MCALPKLAKDLSQLQVAALATERLCRMCRLTAWGVGPLANPHAGVGSNEIGEDNPAARFLLEHKFLRACPAAGLRLVHLARTCDLRPILPKPVIVCAGLATQSLPLKRDAPPGMVRR